MSGTDFGKASLTFRILRFLVQGLLRIVFRIRIEGLENLPRQGGYILAGNHLSWLDPFLMLAFAPATPRIYFTGDKHNMLHPAWRRIFTQSVGGVILVERGEHGERLNEQVDEVLRGGGVLGIFPEGTVSETETGQLLPLHKGAGYFAVHSNAPLVPVAFHGTKEPYLGKRIRVIIGKPVAARSGDKEVAGEQTALLAQAIQAILPPPPSDAGKIKILHDFFTYMFMKPAEVAEAKARAREIKPVADYSQATWSFRVARILITLLMRLLFRLRVEGLENLPREGGYILAGNHLNGYLDPLLVLAFAPPTPRIYLIGAKEEVFYPEWRKIFTERIGGVIAVDRYKRMAAREVSAKVSEVLAGGGVLATFPEGDVPLMETGQLLPFKKGTAYFAVHNNVPLVPIAFHGTKELYVGKKVKLVVGKPLPARTGGKAVVEEQNQVLAQAIQALLSPPPPPYRGPKILRDFLSNLFTQEENDQRRAEFKEQQAK